MAYTIQNSNLKNKTPVGYQILPFMLLQGQTTLADRTSFGIGAYANSAEPLAGVPERFIEMDKPRSEGVARLLLGRPGGPSDGIALDFMAQFLDEGSLVFQLLR